MHVARYKPIYEPYYLSPIIKYFLHNTSAQSHAQVSAQVYSSYKVGNMSYVLGHILHLVCDFYVTIDSAIFSSFFRLYNCVANSNIQQLWDVKLIPKGLECANSAGVF